LRLSFGWVGGLGGQQGHVDVFEDLAGGDAKNSVGGFDEVVAFASGVLTAESVGEGEAGGQLLGFDQKASAVGGPGVGWLHAVLSSRLSAFGD